MEMDYGDFVIFAHRNKRYPRKNNPHNNKNI